MASYTSTCGICSFRQITKTSKHWCSICEEALCDECKEHHKLLKVTRSHEPVPINNYQSLPSFVTEIQQSCDYHNEQYQIYCNEHALPLCLKCINDHSKCNVNTLENVTINVKTSGQFQDLESRLDDLLQNIDRIKKDRKANVTNIEKIKSRHVKEIQQIRVEINNHLDNLEKQIIKDLEEKVCQCKRKYSGSFIASQKKETMINQCHANFKSIKQYASDLQTFLGMREIEVKVKEHEQFLQSLIETKGFEQLEIEYKVNTGMQSILNNVRNFGSTEIKARPSNIEFTRAKNKQAQLQVAPVRRTVNDIKLMLEKTITTYGEVVRGCCMSRERGFLFTDHYKKTLIVIKSDGNLKYMMSVNSSNGFDITFVDEKTVAITSGDSYNKKGINIINIASQSKIKFIDLTGRSYGITSDLESLFVCVEERGIYKVNTVDYTTSHVISCNLPRYSYVSVFADKIYYTDIEDHSVVCCYRNGSHVWTFKKHSVLNGSRGITVDNDGNVFVVGEISSNVVIISNDGRHHKEILTKEDGLNEPSAISFDKHNKKLLVANYKKNAFFYNAN
ncbi:unnamed protein product [Mytilus coruscus]|uniref:B box-type domain-containing protein n=1 Tax=Mytilus coruscus TaxID=42192 RepID=A0A6J8CEE7_MYTCO|nr:unnamed protein product [Mytilus coruscus]